MFTDALWRTSARCMRNAGETGNYPTRQRNIDDPQNRPNSRGITMCGTDHHKAVLLHGSLQMPVDRKYVLQIIFNIF